MKKINIIIVILAAVVMFAALILLLKEQPPTPVIEGESKGIVGEIYNVKMQNYTFIPAELIIKKGDTVKWTNYDDVGHSVLFENYPKATSQVFSKNKSYEYAFDEAGVFEYICGPHPRMIGKIIVQ